MRMRGWKVGVPYAAWAFELGHYVRGFRSDWEYVVVVVSELESTALLGRELSNRAFFSHTIW